MVQEGFFAIFCMIHKAGIGFSVFQGAVTILCEMCMCSFLQYMNVYVRKHNVSPVPQLAYTFSIIFSIIGTVKEYDRVKTNVVNVPRITYIYI